MKAYPFRMKLCSHDETARGYCMTTRWIEWALLILLGVVALSLARQIKLNPYEKLGSAIGQAVEGHR